VLTSELSTVWVVHLHESLPDLGFLKDEHSLNLSVLRKQFIKEIMRDDVTRFVVNANK
jgi:hypothetical protein